MNEQPLTSTTTQIADMPTLKRAIEGRDARLLSGLYADDAEMRVVDHIHMPKSPMEVRGKPAIAAFIDDICGRAMTHKIEEEVVGNNRIAYTEACAYPDGTNVLSSNTLELRDGKIVRQTVVQAWDE